MTREELKEHCERQIQHFERVEKIMPLTPNDWKRYEEHKLILELLEQVQESYEKYSQIVELMDDVIMNPPPYCRPYRYTKKQTVYDTMYKIQRIIGKVRFANEEIDEIIEESDTDADSN